MKNSFKFVLSTLAIFLCVFIFSACKNQKENLSLSLYKNVSETRDSFFVGKTENCFVTFTSGKRESDYKIDGIHTKNVDYGVLVVKFEKDFQSNLTFELKIDDKTFSNILEKNPYDNTYVFDIESFVNCDQKISLKIDGLLDTVDLSCLSKDWKCNQDRALEIFKNKFKKDMSLYEKETSPTWEIFIKIISTEKDLNDICWYVLLVDSDGKLLSTLIKVSNGEIVQF